MSKGIPGFVLAASLALAGCSTNSRQAADISPGAVDASGAGGAQAVFTCSGTSCRLAADQPKAKREAGDTTKWTMMRYRCPARAGR